MADIYFQLAFARRLRFASGLHPFVREAMVRRAPCVALGATMSTLPAVGGSGTSFFRKLLGFGKGEATRWRDRLQSQETTTPNLSLYLLSPSDQTSVGALPRIALAMGNLASVIATEKLAETVRGLTDQELLNVQRGQARLWTQNAVPVQRHLKGEWSPALQFMNAEQTKPILKHLSKSLGAAFSEEPPKELVSGWAKGLATTIRPVVEKSSLPPALEIPDHTVREKYFDGSSQFLERSEDAIAHLVYLSGLIGNAFIDGEPDLKKFEELLLSDGSFVGVPAAGSVDEKIGEWHRALVADRNRSQERGRNPQAAFTDTSGMVSVEIPPLPDEGPLQTVTQEVSVSDIQAEIAKSKGVPDTGDFVVADELEIDDVAEIEEVDGVLAEAEDDEGAESEDASANGAKDNGTSTPPSVPTSTQQLSVDEIAVAIGETSAAPTVPDFLIPVNTQKVMMEDIEAEALEATVEGPIPVPKHTLQLSSADIEQEIANASPLPPSQTLQLSASDIEAELITTGGTVPQPLDAPGPDEAERVTADYPNPNASTVLSDDPTLPGQATLGEPTVSGEHGPPGGPPLSQPPAPPPNSLEDDGLDSIESGHDLPAFSSGESRPADDNVSALKTDDGEQG